MRSRLARRHDLLCVQPDYKHAENTLILLFKTHFTLLCLLESAVEGSTEVIGVVAEEFLMNLNRNGVRAYCNGDHGFEEVASHSQMLSGNRRTTWKSAYFMLACAVTSPGLPLLVRCRFEGLILMDGRAS